MRTYLLNVCLCLSLAASSQAAVYNLQDPNPNNRRVLRLNIPTDLEEIRGILIHGNGANGNSVGQATDAELVAFGESIGFAVLATGYWGNFSSSDNSTILLFETMLAEFAEMSGHPELVDAPWLPMGHSNGGQMSYGFNTKRPWKVIGFITSKGCCYNDARPQTAALLTPGMLVAGEKDTQFRRDQIKGLFDRNRSRGALWAWVEEEGSGHGQMNSQQLKLTFLAECVRLRYPPDASPVNGPVVLKDLNECDGWLVDHNTWKQGLTRIYPFAAAPGEPRALGWVPNEKIARYYQAFSSYGKAGNGVSGSSGVVVAPTALTYTVRLPGSGRRGGVSVDFYFDGQFIGQGDPNDGERPTISVEQTEGGLHAFCAVTTDPSGSQRATFLRRVFVKGPRTASAFEQWARDSLPKDHRDPQGRLFDDGIINLERFAFGLSLTEPNMDFQPLQPGDPPVEIMGEIEFAVYTYPVNKAAVAAGLNIRPQVRQAGGPWTNILDITDPDFFGPAPQIICQGSRVTFKYPLIEEGLSFRIAVSDTYEGVDPP